MRPTLDIFSSSSTTVLNPNTNNKINLYESNFYRNPQEIIPIQSLTENNTEIFEFSSKLEKSTIKGQLIFINECNEYVLAKFCFDEKEHKGLENTTFNIYRKVFTLLQKKGMNFLRAWNFIPNILGKEGLERYRLFNKGRWKAWNKFGPIDEDSNPVRPATTVVGCNDGPLIVEVLFCHEKVIHIENPRQKQFIHYSKKWGPYPPISARGSLHIEQNYNTLYISGTASLIGEETVNIGCPLKQTIEIINNIKVLISKDNLERYGINEIFSLRDLKLIRVYIKKKEDYSKVEKIIREQLPHSESLYLHSDICRPEFLVEIEGVMRKLKKYRGYI